MDAILIDLVKKYIHQANSIANQMLIDFEVSTKEEFLKTKCLYLNGEKRIKGEYKYIFHGRGCRCLDKAGNVLIDWDFGYDNLLVGINIGSFVQFIEKYDPQNAKVFNYNIIKKHFDEMVSTEIMYRRYYLYYLK